MLIMMLWPFITKSKILVDFSPYPCYKGSSKGKMKEKIITQAAGWFAEKVLDQLFVTKGFLLGDDSAGPEDFESEEEYTKYVYRMFMDFE